MHYTRWLRHGDPLKKINKRIPSICAVPDCRNMSRTRDWCRKHYLAWLRHGDPETQVQFSTPEESFLARTERVGDCLIWTGYTNPKGYGQIQVKDRKSTRLNSSHVSISYAVFCTKKKTRAS